MCIWERRTMPGGFGIGGTAWRGQAGHNIVKVRSVSKMHIPKLLVIQLEYCSLAQIICSSEIANIFHNKLQVQPCWPSGCWNKYFCRSHPLKKGKNSLFHSLGGQLRRPGAKWRKIHSISSVLRSSSPFKIKMRHCRVLCKHQTDLNRPPYCRTFTPSQRRKINHEKF